jgi:hypothetical protein
MKTKNIVAVFIITFVITSCASSVTVTPTETVLPMLVSSPTETVLPMLVSSPTETVVPAIVASPTKTPVPTAPPTLQPTNSPSSPLNSESKYLSNLPLAPSGFAWKIIPEYKLAVLVPSGWFFKQNDVFDMNVVGEVVVSQNNFDDNGKFSTGMAVIEFASDNPDELAKSLLTEYIDAKAITKTIDSWDSQINGRNAQNVKFNANFPDEADTIVQLSVITSGSWVYLVILKSPSALWEKVADDYDVMLNHVTIFDE